MEKVNVVFIRVDHNRRVFQESDPGTVDINSDGKVNDIILEAGKYDPSLQAIPLKKIQVYKLKTPIAALPMRGTRSTDSKKAAFENLSDQIKQFGVTSDHLDFLRQSQPVSVFEKRSDDHITAIIYHPPLDDDCEHSVHVFASRAAC